MSDQKNPLEELTPGHLAPESAPVLDKLEDQDFTKTEPGELVDRDYSSDMGTLPGDSEDKGEEPVAKPALMKKGEAYVVVGSATVKVFENYTLLQVTLDTEDGHDVGKLIATEMITGISVGAILDPEVKAAFVAAAG